MADQCMLCGGKVSIGGKRCLDGPVCKSCCDNMPQSINIKACGLAALMRINEYEKTQKKEMYGATASYGKLHLDEMRGYVILSDKLDNEGSPPGHYEVYCLADVKEIGLYPVNPQAAKGSVTCDVEFSLILSSPEIGLRTTVKRNAKCTFKQVSPSKVEWTEPGDLAMFRNMLNQAIKTSVQRKVRQKIPELTQEGVTLFQAESAFFLREGYTREEVEDHGVRLLHAFEDANGGEDMKVYMDAVHYYYQVLTKELDKKEGKR